MMDAQQAAFYKKVENFLVTREAIDPFAPTVFIKNGNSSVIMKGELAGYSVWSLKEYYAGMNEKKTEYEEE